MKIKLIDQKRLFQVHTPHGYNSGGAGYLLSAKAVEMLLQHLQRKGFCPPEGLIEDLDLAKCLAKLKIYPKNTLDEEGRITFHSLNPYPLLAGDPTLSSVYTYSKNNVSFGYRHVSKNKLSLFSFANTKFEMGSSLKYER